MFSSLAQIIFSVSKNFIGSIWLQLIKHHYVNTLIQELGSTKTYERISSDERFIVNAHSIDINAV